MARRSFLRAASGANCVTGIEDGEYDIADLRVGSAVIEAEPIPEFADAGPAVAELYQNTIDAIQDYQPLDPRIDFRTISAFNLFSGIAMKPGVAISIGRTTITRAYSERIAGLLEPESTSMGSVNGRLESVSIHGAPKFVLYPPVRGEQIECIFDRSDLPAVAQALGQDVAVYGRLGYARSKSFPVHVNVVSFETVPTVDELPTLLNARGTMDSPIESTELIRAVRNEIIRPDDSDKTDLGS
ncbi:MAG TPA: hypothetical protein VMV69_16040 [Pirellulales bacterium]|nr:hypothetical protein [Pirellulales bacterium]